MTVKQLKEFIADLPDDMQILSRGYEQGADAVEYAVVSTFTFNEKNPFYYGAYEFDSLSQNKFLYFQNEKR
jgi:hypothetical protein